MKSGYKYLKNAIKRTENINIFEKNLVYVRVYHYFGKSNHQRSKCLGKICTYLQYTE